MGAGNWTCSECGTQFGPPRNGKMVCAKCGAIQSSGVSSDGEGADASLAPLQTQPPTTQPKPGEAARELLAQVDEDIAGLVAEIEALRVREQAAPLKLGCAVFGVFSAVVVVLALFSTVARPLFGSWIFYLVLALVVVLGGLYRILPEMAGRAESSRLARQRAEIELTLSQLRIERERIERLERLES